MPDGAREPSPECPSGDPTGEDRLWDDWDTPLRVPSMPVLHLDGFDGPMDLLLDLAERQRIDLGRISVRALAEQFVTEMERVAAHVPVERRADWLVLATRLVLLHSRLLFPANHEEAAAAERDAAREVDRLEEIQFVRAAAAWLQARPQLGQEVFARPSSGPDPHVASYMALLEACLTVLRGDGARATDEVSVYRPAFPELFRVPDAIVRMRSLLAVLSGPVQLREFYPRMPVRAGDGELIARSAVSSTFLAALELARGRELALRQDGAFGPIGVEPMFSAAVQFSTAP
jgi:segregation and condensation protein A